MQTAKDASTFDYLGWAKRPGSQLALDKVFEAARRDKDPRFVEIVAKLVADGVATEGGQLLYRWDVLDKQWVPVRA